MNLELLEDKTVKYLQQVTTPLTRVESLLRHLHQTEDFAGLTERELIGFLEDHDSFHIIRPLPFSDPGIAHTLSKAGFTTGTCVILGNRMPPRDALARLMLEQLHSLKGALLTAFREARTEGDDAEADRIKDALNRADTLQKKIGKELRPE